MDAAGSLAGRSKDSAGWMPMSNRGSVLGGWGSGEARCRLSSHHPARPCFANPQPHCARLNTFLTTDADQDSAEPLAGKFKAGRATLRGLPDGHSDPTGVNWCAKAWFIIRSRGIPMDRHELARTVRNTYSDAMKAHHTTEAAIRECGPSYWLPWCAVPRLWPASGVLGQADEGRCCPWWCAKGSTLAD